MILKLILYLSISISTLIRSTRTPREDNFNPTAWAEPPWSSRKESKFESEETPGIIFQDTSLTTHGSEDVVDRGLESESRLRSDALIESFFFINGVLGGVLLDRCVGLGPSHDACFVRRLVIASYRLTRAGWSWFGGLGWASELFIRVRYVEDLRNTSTLCRTFYLGGYVDCGGEYCLNGF